jgi:hypothetical protein
MTVPRRTRRRFAPFLLGCAASALAAPGAAQAQAFQADPNVAAGTVNFDRSTPGVDVITVETPSAIIDWRIPAVSGPPPDPYVFLPAGNIGMFQNGASNADFAVLNRIVPIGSRIQFDGTVVSRLQRVDGIFPGGTVAFYSPNGIIVSGSAVFDVGNLLLTTLEPFVDASDQWIPGGFLQLRANLQFPPASITVAPGASISAISEGSWVAVVAPALDLGGTTRVNGSVAYVAGQDVNLTIDQGLFDIQVILGTDQATPFVHRGTTGGPASSAAGDNHLVYMVATPQNQAITALLEGNVGFDPAISAAVENGAIILSAGHDVQGRDIDPRAFAAGAANFEIGRGTMTSDVTGAAANEFLAGGEGAGTLTFEQDVSIHGRQRALLYADQGFRVRVEGNASVSSANPSRLVGGNPNTLAGEARIHAGSDGIVTVVGNARVDASAVGAVSELDEVGSGTGGTAGVDADKATVTVGGSLTLLATGTGGDGLDAGAPEGGAGTGGTASVVALNGGAIAVGGDLAVDSSGTGSRGYSVAPAAGSPGTGGNALLTAISGGSVTAAGSASLRADGTGANVDLGAQIAGGGQGGTASIVAAVGTIDLAGATIVSASGFGGSGPAGGNGAAGTAGVEATDGQVALTGGVAVRAEGIGGNATAAGRRGGDGTGGAARVLAHSGAAPGILTGGSALVSGNGTGGSGGSGATGGRGGDGRAGSAEILAEASNGRVQLGASAAQANATGGAGGSGAAGAGGRGGDAVAGPASAGTVADAVLPASNGSATFAALSLSSTAVGGAGGAGAPAGAGGTADSNQVRLVSTGAPVTVTGIATLNADASGGLSPGGARGRADGGDILVESLARGATAGSLAIGTLNGSTAALGASDGTDTLGRWRLIATGGAIDLGAASLSALVSGTPAVLTGSSITVDDGTVTVAGPGTFASRGEVRVTANGTGRIAGGDVSLNSATGIALTHSNAPPGAATIDAANFSAVTAGSYAADAGTVLIGRNSVTINAGTTATLTSTFSGGAIAVVAGGAATAAGPVVGQTVAIAGQDVRVAAGGSVGSDATAAVTLTAARDYMAAAGTTVRGATVNIVAGADATLALTAAGGIANVTAGGLATIAGPLTGAEVRVTSADIALPAGGTIGNAFTGLVLLQAQPAATATTVGGAVQGAGYTLTQAEASRIRAGTLRVAPLGGAAIVARDLTLDGGGAGVGALELATAGAVRVEGALLLGNAGAGGRIGIAAGGRVEVVTPGGGVRVRNAAGAPAGTVTIAGSDIWVTDAAIGGQLAANPNFAGRDAALLANAGADVPLGYVEAGTVQLAPRTTLFVQNSGTATAYAGITVGAGGLEIVPSGAQPAIVYAFGRRLNADGSFTLNDAFFRQVDFNRGAAPGYTNPSEFNRCFIVSGLCPRAFNRVPGSSFVWLGGPTREQIELAEDEVLDESAFAAEPLIEEPVTSGADSTLWIGPDDDDGEDEDEDEEE